MKEKLEQLIHYALEKDVRDIHFYCSEKEFKIQIRQMDGIHEIEQDLWDESLFAYLKYVANLDLTNPKLPQSGSFSMKIKEQLLFARFSIIKNQKIETGVLRLLSTKPEMAIEELTSDPEALDFMKAMCHFRQGLFLSCGPTNSGKTTTIHAILHEIALKEMYKIVSLEDPIEIEDPLMLQLQINEEEGFSYEKGIEQLMRHDPDIIYIGEIRNAYCAKKLINCALSGHMVVSTLHAGTGKEAILRLLDFGIDPYELSAVLKGIFSQRLYQNKEAGKECVYEVVGQHEIDTILQTKEYSKNHKKLDDKIRAALESGSICDRQAEYDLLNYTF